MSLQDELEDLMPSSVVTSPFAYLNGIVSHMNGVLLTAFFVFGAVVAYIVYIIHLYDSGQLGGTDPAKPATSRRGRNSAAQRRQDEKWMKKFD